MVENNYQFPIAQSQANHLGELVLITNYELVLVLLMGEFITTPVGEGDRHS